MTYIQNPLTYEAPAKAGSISKRQEEIIDKACMLLSLKGSEGLTIKNLANEMNFSEAALYRHFQNKEKIIVGLINNLIFKLDDILSQLNNELKPAERYTLYFDALFTFFDANRDYVDIAFSDGLFGPSDEVKQALQGVTNMFQKHLIPIVMDGKLTGDFPMTLNADRILHILFGSYRLQMQKWSNSKYNFDVTRTGNDIMTALLQLFK